MYHVRWGHLFIHSTNIVWAHTYTFGYKSGQGHSLPSWSCWVLIQSCKGQCSRGCEKFPDTTCPDSTDSVLFPGLWAAWRVKPTSTHLPSPLCSAKSFLCGVSLVGYGTSQKNRNREENIKAKKHPRLLNIDHFPKGMRVVHFRLTKRIFPQTPVVHTPPQRCSHTCSLGCQILRSLSKGGVGPFLEPNWLF